MPYLAHRVFSGENTLSVLLTLSVLTTLLVLGWIVLAVKLNRLQRRFGALGRNMDGHNLEEVLVSHMEVVDHTVRRMDALEQAVAVLQAQMPYCLQRAHLVRYDAFDDVGGEQSFSLAILDANGDGLVVSSVYSRMDVRVYAKAIRKGHASHALSGEEERALQG